MALLVKIRNIQNMGAKRIRQGCVSYTLHAELSICS